MDDSFKFIRPLRWADGTTSRFVSLREVERGHPAVTRFPASMRILLEAALRNFDAELTTSAHLEHLLGWSGGLRGEVPVWVARVLLQDASGIPLLSDLAAMRAAAQRAGITANTIQPKLPTDLVIDHSVAVDAFGGRGAQLSNLEIEYARNAERFQFAKWAAQAFDNVRVFPPGSGIVHQVNLEYLASGIVQRDGLVFPDTLVGTDSHTTMVNGLGVLGWGVGGLEAEIALLGQPIYIQAPDVVGVMLTGSLPAGAAATDIALQLTYALRERGVVGKLLEFVGPGARALEVPARATIANMAPEYGATMGYFGVDEVTLAYMAQTGRSRGLVERIRHYYSEQRLFGIPDPGEIDYSSVISFDLSRVCRTIAGPSRPQQRLALRDVPASLPVSGGLNASHESANASKLDDGAVVLAAITSCTNTANPAAMLTAGLLARAAVARGLRPAAHVKTVLAPGSRAVTRYLERAGLLEDLQSLGFFVAAYGCAVCVGNSGALVDGVEEEIVARELSAVAVLSGNRNFEGRIHRSVKANYLASPALVVAYALAGTVSLDLETAPLGLDKNGQPVFLCEIWPDEPDIEQVAAKVVDEEVFQGLYSTGSEPGDNHIAAMWAQVPSQQGPLFRWGEDSNYFVEPPFFNDRAVPASAGPIRGARVLAVFGDAITTDHISPVGEIAPDSAAARYLRSLCVEQRDFNNYGARRCNHNVMIRGTFANPRIRNLLADRDAGPVTRSARDGLKRSLFDVAQENAEDGVPSVIIAGQLYGSGSARDWAAKGTALLGVAAVLAKSFERIHRSNLTLMGVLPVELPASSAFDTLRWHGSETVDIEFDPDSNELQAPATVVVRRKQNIVAKVFCRLRIDTQAEWLYIRSGGVLPLIFQQQLSANRNDGNDRRSAPS